jgi:O-acetyl-ADP-ribose deacetylase (regulator of RNase III)
MISAKRGNICDIVDVDYICSVANSFGPMVSNVAKSIKLKGGKSIEDECFRSCSKIKYKVGDIFTTNVGTLKYKKILHIVTTNYPNEKTSYENIEKCLTNLIPYCKMMNIKKIAVPSIGLGSSDIKIDKLSEIFKSALSSEKKIDFIVVDPDPVFIYQFL